jgi:CBS domain-containing protein
MKTPEEPKVVALVPVRETARAIDANKMLAEFANATEELTTESDHMAGFFVVVWNDEGHYDVRYHFTGARNPLATPLIHDMVKNVSRSACYPPAT